MKLITQIPCLDERETLAETLADLLRRTDGVDEIEVPVIGDGRSDGTSERAAELGVHHIVRFSQNRGLAAVFMAGSEAALAARRRPHERGPDDRRRAMAIADWRERR